MGIDRGTNRQADKQEEVARMVKQKKVIEMHGTRASPTHSSIITSYGNVRNTSIFLCVNL